MSWEHLTGDELLDRVRRAERRLYRALSLFPDNHPMQRWLADWADVLATLEWVAEMGAPSDCKPLELAEVDLTGAETVDEATAWLEQHWRELAA